MRTEIKQIIGINIRTLREGLGLSQLEFSNIVGISRASLINIESGKTGYNINLLDNILTFSNYKLQDLSTQIFHVPNDLRDKLANLYKKNPSIYTLLNRKPSIVYAINYKLLPSSFLDSPKEINEIKSFFENLKWSFNGPSIQNALKRMPEHIIIQKHITKKNTYLYSKR